MQITSIESNFVNLSYSNHVLQALFGFLNIVYFYVINILYFYNTQGYLFCLIIFSRQYIRYNILHQYRYCSNYGPNIFCFYKHSHDAPIYKVTYSKRNKKYSEWIIFYNNKKVRTSLYLKQIIQWLEGQHLKIINQ